MLSTAPSKSSGTTNGGASDDHAERADRRVHVLVVDDDPDFRDSMRYVLESDGYLVDTAADGAQATDALRSRAPDLIILDLMMPVKNGWQVLDELKADPALRNIPVIVMTSTGLRQGAVGATIVLNKNISALVLLKKIADAIRG